MSRGHFSARDISQTEADSGAQSAQKGSEQPVELSVSDIEAAIKNVQPERVIVRQELRQRTGEPIEVLHEKIEFRVTALQQASAVFELVRPHLLHPEREIVDVKPGTLPINIDEALEALHTQYQFCGDAIIARHSQEAPTDIQLGRIRGAHLNIIPILKALKAALSKLEDHPMRGTDNGKV